MKQQRYMGAAALAAILGLALWATAGTAVTSADGKYHYKADQNHVLKINLAAEKTTAKPSNALMWSVVCDGPVQTVALSADQTKVTATTPHSVYVLNATTGAQLSKTINTATAKTPLKSGYLPPVVDLRQYQSGIRDQGERDTCPYFPVVGALEAAYRHLGTSVDLSVEHLVWLRNETGLNETYAGTRDKAENLIGSLGGGGLKASFQVLSKYAISRQADMPYHSARAYGEYTSAEYQGFGIVAYDWSKPYSQFLLNRWNLDPKQLPPQARANARYGIDQFVMLPEADLHNPAAFEKLLAAGHEVVWSLAIHDDVYHTDPGQPVWRLQPGSKSVNLNHLTLVVGYDHDRHFFIVKNSWGPVHYNPSQLAAGWKDIAQYEGYTLVDYNYLSQCTEAGYIAAATPLSSSRFVHQRALGQWHVSFTNNATNQVIKTGVLSWRRLPHMAYLPKADLRIGDLVTTDGHQYRVNAQFTGGAGKVSTVTLYLDLATGTLPYYATGSHGWTGSLVLPDSGAVSMSLHHTGSAGTFWGTPAGFVRLTATQVNDHNLLKSIAVP
jgi:hypothetical protein